MTRLASTLVLLAACTSSDVTPDTDAGIERDAGLTGGSGEYWPCYFWPSTVNKCAPKCSNKTLLGRPTFGAGCEIGPGIFCKAENMTGVAGEGGGCCWESDAKTVDYHGCL